MVYDEVVRLIAVRVEFIRVLQNTDLWKCYALCANAPRFKSHQMCHSIGGPLEAVNFLNILVFNLHFHTPRSWSLVLTFLLQGNVQTGLSTEMVHRIRAPKLLSLISLPPTFSAFSCLSW